MTEPWQEAVRHAADLDLQRVPADVRQHAVRVIADTVGVSVAGHRQPQMRALCVDQSEHADQASGSWVLAEPPLFVDAEDAAFLNATAGSFLELDEGIRPTGHPGMHLVPAALAVAQAEHRSGADLLRAVMAGYEVTARLFVAFRLRYPVHPHGHLGGVGAAVAVAMLTGVDPLTAAEIVATTPHIALWNACNEGATARNTLMGHAAASAVRASRLARAGFTGSVEAISVGFGTVFGDLADAAVLTAPLDYAALGITRNYFKVHSACALNHAAIDALLGMELPAADLIEAIDVETVQNSLKLDRLPAPNDLSARFSLPYAVAAVARSGASTLDTFRYDEATARLARRVSISAPDDLDAAWPDGSPARVAIRWTGGVERGSVDNPRGHFTRPLTPAEIESKFRTNTGTPALWDALMTLETVADSSTLLGAWPTGDAGVSEKREQQ